MTQLDTTHLVRPDTTWPVCNTIGLGDKITTELAEVLCDNCRHIARRTSPQQLLDDVRQALTALDDGDDTLANTIRRIKAIVGIHH